MSKEYPLFPKLSDEAKNEAESFLLRFKEQVKKAADEAVADVYTSCVQYIESDSWLNFRNEILDGFRNYNNRKIIAKYDFKEIRKSILDQFRNELISDLNQDMVEEIKSLKKELKHLRENLRF